MRLLYDSLIPAATLREEASLAADVIDVFEGDVLDAEAARRVSEALGLPPLPGRRAVVCTYNTALPRAFDILLKPVEDAHDDVDVLVACPGPYSETFESRFNVVDVPALDRASLFEAFAGFDRDNSLEDFITAHPHLPVVGVRTLHDEFMQGIGQIVEFVTSVHDRTREIGLRVCASFTPTHAQMLACELDLQLQERSLARRILSRVPQPRLLLAASYAEVMPSMLPSTYAALAWHALT